MDEWCPEWMGRLLRDAEGELGTLPARWMLAREQYRLQDDQTAPDYGPLEAEIGRIKAAIVDEMRRLLEDGRFHLRGTQALPEFQTSEQVIPSVWAADLQLDLDASTAEFHGRRFLNVRAHAGPAPRSNDTSTPSPTSLADVPSLPDEVLLAIIEEYAQRTIKSGAPMPQTKISLVPIIRRKMVHRSELGELADTLADEARFLATWIADVVTSHQTPTASAIENSLRSEYRTLRARSKGTMRSA